ncbi:MAG: tyrosine-type recombinase/integrase [Syntrophales bacterium]
MAKTKDHNLVKRNNVWHFRKVVNGKLIKRALSQSITEARNKRDELLRQIQSHGDIQDNKPVNDINPLFGELAQVWVGIISKEIKLSTLTDYRYSMNRYILPRFVSKPIKEIGHIDIRKFVAELTCAHKRKNNVLVPMRSVFKMAFMDEIIDKNPMDRIRNLKTDKPDICPLSMKDVRLFLDNVSLRFKNFFTVAFLTGMRFGEMAVLKWHNVDFRLGVIKVRETRVMGEKGRPKTKKSTRYIKMLPPVVQALRDQRKETFGKSDYVFLNQYGVPLDPSPTNLYVWKPALKKSGLKPRSMYQTRHTFATLMLDAGEHPGWVQRMMGHETMQMIYKKYYSYIGNYERDEGKFFMEWVFNSKTEIDSEDPELSQMS